MIQYYDKKISKFSDLMPTVGVKDGKIDGWVEDYSIGPDENFSEPAPEPEDKSLDFHWR